MSEGVRGYCEWVWMLGSRGLTCVRVGGLIVSECGCWGAEGLRV